MTIFVTYSSTAHHILFILNRFSVKYRFHFQILRIFTVKSPSVTQRSFLKKKNQKTKTKTKTKNKIKKKGKEKSCFSAKLLAQINLLPKFKTKVHFFNIAKFEFKVTVHLAYVKNTQLSTLKAKFLYFNNNYM